MSHTDWRLSKLPGEVPRSVDAVSGTQKSGASTNGPWNRSAATPSTVNGDPLSTIALPTIDESASKRRLQNR
jgi:hypothetical protein